MMYLREALKNDDDVDPTRPLIIGFLELGEEAAAVAAAILSGDIEPPAAALTVRNFVRPVYWSVDHAAEGHAEIFGFPIDWKEKLPTAIEVALVKAAAVLPPDQHPAIFSGGAEIVLGSASACAGFRKVALAAENPMVGETTEFDGSTSAVIVTGDGRGVKIALDCLLNSYATAPLKFRFLELYRVMEALFIADVKSRLFTSFDSEPTLALNDALEALQSELRQIIALAEPHQDLFEECWALLDGLKNTNQFAAALFRRLSKKKLNGGSKWQTGAALVYQIRCAVVHAGEKDMIFENFPDGDTAVRAILPVVERAALQMLGITLD
ncbi:hypothetical protein [Agrobacterium tumefaciens]|uniref:hypothetical protein n=1 Tax=Agrobacterium tumefaciens TaxID=358 RepID=UPI001571CF8B|nr:hypothetical protein [Agrobacterium tumefaciens]NTE33385.1 hypothetical protein [Agrobacterium tumefaciens]NTE48895.1 hypothetical protein [Agrobacterium tumefaciens]